MTIARAAHLREKLRNVAAFSGTTGKPVRERAPLSPWRGLFCNSVTSFVAGKTQSDFLWRSREPSPAPRIALLRENPSFRIPQVLGPASAGPFSFGVVWKSFLAFEPP